ncbi:MAG: hypothetical protein U0414_39835 [Polyangiaceae bacterium]
MSDDFVIRRHSAPAILEVVYPEQADTIALTRYLVSVRAGMEAMPARWACLVDQLAWQGELGEAMRAKVALLNDYAIHRGMHRCARIVRPGREVEAARATGLGDSIVRTFLVRSEALGWLVSELSGRA